MSTIEDMDTTVLAIGTRDTAWIETNPDGHIVWVPAEEGGTVARFSLEAFIAWLREHKPELLATHGICAPNGDGWLKSGDGRIISGTEGEMLAFLQSFAANYPQTELQVKPLPTTRAT